MRDISLPKIYELHTERLLLRQWRTSDLHAFAQMNGCEKVMEYFPHPLTSVESDAIAHRLTKIITEKGWGFWANEEKNSQKFIGSVGLKQTDACLPFSPAVEIGWRLDSQYWHKGYATEAAKKSLEFAFNELNLKEVISFTAKINKPSIKVMERIGMVDTGKPFNHPIVEKNSSLLEHVLYKIEQVKLIDGRGA
ncbi:GNAT family N-acetyltransferase [Pseudocolwellia sp. AS88]|uniref:GNAT family N-acetyltransferase n=1 Tax=Pseudocolwellia sp. AS88 TaxID=3063958 RepID=UPI0026F1FC0A|nr:GNAT family N-acetyltransferase [Pseudocolwellia sp. AS88]MDO7083823.1 GNAT family N-acetyltransferase [Pseudocolwellia sp. AS88]